MKRSHGESGSVHVRPYGYWRRKVQDGGKMRSTLEADPITCWVVERMFAMASSGLGCKEIATSLNRDEVPSPRGKRWGKSGVHMILTNVAYKGTLAWGVSGAFHRDSGLEPVTVPGAFPSLVPPKVFDRVQQQLKARAPKIVAPARAGSSYLLSGLVRCGKCGAAMFGHAAKSGAYHYYVCSTVHRNGKHLCDTKPIPQALVEKGVMGKIQEIILQEEHLEELVRLTNLELEQSLADVTTRLGSLDAQLADLGERLGRLYDALETGKVDLDDLTPRIKKLKERRDLISRARGEVEETLIDGKIEVVNREVVLSYISDLSAVLETGTVSERRAFLSSFIESIETKDTAITVRYTLPLPPGEADLDPEKVLDFVGFGGPKWMVGGTIFEMWLGSL